MATPAEPDLRALIEKSTRAPSSHNTQPWLFELRGEAVALHADRTRALPVNDPYDRELTISCGAALANLELAAVEAGREPEVVSLPDAADTDLLATVRVPRRAGAADDPRAALAAQIERRHSTRDAFEDAAVPEGLGAELAAIAERHGVWLTIVDDPGQREAVADLVARGDQTQFADPSWRRELASWMHPRRKGDGLATPELVAPVSRLVVRAFDLGRSTAGKDQRLVIDAPLLVALGTERDDARAWLDAGRALEEVLLRATAEGLAAGYLNQPCQVAALRHQLQQTLGHPGFPQLVLRLGRASEPATRAPRRAVEDVMLG